MKKVILLLLISTIISAQKKTIEQRVDSVLALMNLEEKVGQLVQYSSGWATGSQTDRPNESSSDLLRKGKIGSFFNVVGAEETKELQRIAIEESRLKIPVIIGLDVIHGYKSTFPVPIAEASSWNPELVKKSARWQAIESSAAGVHWTFNPMVDIARDPRWGRIVEGSGEDLYLGAAMAVARVKGYQGDDLSASNTIAACVKHFAGYGAAEGGRDYNTVDFSDRTFHEIYLRPFKAAVDAGAATLMSSFNEIGGVPSSASHYLLTKVLRGMWGFDGFVVSDWNSVGELIPHGVAANLKEAGELGIKAGVDMDMEGNAYFRHMVELVNEGKVSNETINESVRRILRIKFRLGLFDDPYKYNNAEIEKKTVLSEDIIKATKEVALESMVLLKNDGLLPFKKDIKKIAVIGPLGQSKEDPLGPWNQQGQKDYVVTVVEGIQNKLGSSAEVLFAEGCKILGEEKSGFSEALETAKKADVIVLSLGESLHQSGEAQSRATLDIPGVQEELAKELYKLGKPMVLVLMNGRPLTINWFNDNVNAIVECWYLGLQSGNAIADVLFGDYNPSGKLPVTFPKYVGQVPTYYNHKNTGRPFNPKVPAYTSYYNDVTIDPLYPFGYGLSYTKFEYSDLTLSKSEFKKDESIKVSFTLKNTGNFAGEEVAQLYVRDLVGSVTRPVKELKDFAKIKLNPGESKTVEFSITSEKLKFFDINMNFVVEPGDFKVFVGGNSVDVIEKSFKVVE
ncbi:MAG: glycoside hydrolase family 3 C-terminal domain-containing protein [Melioribacteraceae bacterium]|nr:glycoside hydrolase family 3 C-terminal domain-containing protein [Melioribacteraceae bacterium]